MGRRSKLTGDQWAEVERRLEGGEGVRALAREFAISPTQVSARLSKQSDLVRAVAHQLAAAQDALALLPIPQQHNALTLTEKLRAVSASMAAAALHGADTAQRLQALANAEVRKVNPATPLAAGEHLRAVGALTRLANDAAVIPLGLMASNRDRMRDDPPPADCPRTIELVGKLSDGALKELMDLKDADEAAHRLRCGALGS